MNAQQVAGDRLAADTAMGAVTLLVGDLDGMTAFYRDVVTLEVLAADGDQAVLGRAGRAIVVLRHDPALRHATPGSAGLFHTAILFESQEALAAALYSVATRAPHTFTGSADHLVSRPSTSPTPRATASSCTGTAPAPSGRGCTARSRWRRCTSTRTRTCAST